MLKQSFLLLKNSARSPYYQTARWNRPRKPFWLGIAKSKMFVIKESNELPKNEDERKEYIRLKHNYITYLHSLLYFIKNENPLANDISQVTLADEKALNALKEESLLKNEEWNLETARLRNERLNTSVTQLDMALVAAARVDNNKRRIYAKVEEIVKNEIETSQSYITLENLDEAIEKCLQNEVDYNYALDLKGNKFLGQDVFQTSTTNVTENKNEHT